MPIYMDRHDIDEGVAAEDMAIAHLKDVMTQEKYGVKYLTYWFDEERSVAFCLVDAPSKEQAELVHREAHGLVANAIMEVDGGAVQEFLGKISDSAAAEGNFKESDPPAESAFRTIMFTDIEGSTALTQRIGDSRAMDLLRTHDNMIRGVLKAHGGREVKHMGDGFMNCFTSAPGAVGCSIAIQKELAAHEKKTEDWPIRVRIGLSAGEPVEEHRDLYGAAVQMASRICGLAEPTGILVSNVIRELSIGKEFAFTSRGEAELRGFLEPVRLYEVEWRSSGSPTEAGGSG
ncbi:MAG: DUF4242 domain-containing protein [Chloroflexi bacterium]|nr:DUF4242 domain-containing protein [Chloroflexota bacterium]